MGLGPKNPSVIKRAYPEGAKLWPVRGTLFFAAYFPMGPARGPCMWQKAQWHTIGSISKYYHLKFDTLLFVPLFPFKMSVFYYTGGRGWSVCVWIGKESLLGFLSWPSYGCCYWQLGLFPTLPMRKNCRKTGKMCIRDSHHPGGQRRGDHVAEHAGRKMRGGLYHPFRRQ